MRENYKSNPVSRTTSEEGGGAFEGVGGCAGAGGGGGRSVYYSGRFRSLVRRLNKRAGKKNVPGIYYACVYYKESYRRRYLLRY